MGHSLACGARAAAGWPWAVVALGDMAWVQPATLLTLRQCLEQGNSQTIVQPLHQGVPGNPVGFGAAWLPALEKLEGDSGARALLRAAGDDVIRIEVNDPGVLQDLDEPPR
jgi:molybdenum cofactor cytidylyltransferase